MACRAPALTHCLPRAAVSLHQWEQRGPRNRLLVLTCFKSSKEQAGEHGSRGAAAQENQPERADCDPGVSSPVTQCMWWARAPSCWTLPSVCPVPIATPLGSSVSSDSVFLWPPCPLTQSCLHFFPSPFQNVLLSERGPCLLRRGPPPFRLSVLPFLCVGIGKCESPSYLAVGTLGTRRPALIQPRISFLMR